MNVGAEPDAQDTIGVGITILVSVLIVGVPQFKRRRCGDRHADGEASEAGLVRGGKEHILHKMGVVVICEAVVGFIPGCYHDRVRIVDQSCNCRPYVSAGLHNPRKNIRDVNNSSYENCVFSK